MHPVHLELLAAERRRELYAEAANQRLVSEARGPATIRPRTRSHCSRSSAGTAESCAERTGPDRRATSLGSSRFPTMKRRSSGCNYQAWLKNPAGTEVSIGTFSSSAGHVTLWSGVSPQQFPMFSVTIEATDNNQASSGRRVLEGETS